MTEPAPLDPKLRNRLTRFLHTGLEVPQYYPGCWTTHKYFEEDKLPVLNEILVNSGTNTEVLDVILKAYKDGFYTRFETIAFALAKCLKLGSKAMRAATYIVASQVCNAPEEMMLFNKYIRILKTGNGQGWCKFVQEWYMRKDPMELAQDATRVRSRYGRSHKTLLRKCHIKVSENDHARDAIIKYSIWGLKRAKQVTTQNETTAAIFEYIEKVENMRHCEDPAVAGAIASQNNFTLDHVPGHLLTAQEVWNAILPQMSLDEMMYNIQRIHNMGFLTNDSTTTAILTSLLNNWDVIKKSKCTPIAVYIALCNYKKKSRPMKYEKAKVALEKEQRRRTKQIFDSKTGLWEWTVTKRHPKEVKNWGIDHPSNPIIIAALTKLIDQTWVLTQPTKARYIITMDMRHHMFKGRHFCKNYGVPKNKKVKVKPTTTPTANNLTTTPTLFGDADTEKKSKKRLLSECFYNTNVTPGHAAIILAMQLLKREKDVKLAVFSEEGVELVNIERNFTNIEEAEFMLRQTNLGRVQLDAPIEFMAKTNQQVDVFINMVDRSTRYMELDVNARGGRGPGGKYGPPPANNDLVDHCPVRALERYRNKVGVRDAKLIVLSLASHHVGTTDGSHEGVLDIVGVDEHVPKIMDAFVLGQFK